MGRYVQHKVSLKYEKCEVFTTTLLTSAVDGGYIKVMDPDTATRYKKYIPYWA